MDPEETPSLITTTSWSAAVLAVVYRPTGSPRVPLRTFRCGDGQGRPTASPALFAWRPTSPANSMSASRIAIIWVTRCLIAAGDQDPLWDYRQLTSRRKGGARTSVFNAVMLLAGDPPFNFFSAGGRETTISLGWRTAGRGKSRVRHRARAASSDLPGCHCLLRHSWVTCGYPPFANASDSGSRAPSHAKIATAEIHRAGSSDDRRSLRNTTPAARSARGIVVQKPLVCRRRQNESPALRRPVEPRVGRSGSTEITSAASNDTPIPFPQATRISG